ncbi:MAG: hypothetical protein ACLFVI_01905 [Archaeoglobaceae archaeon]
MGEKYGLSIREDLGESEKDWEEVMEKIRDISGRLGWSKTVEIIDKISSSVKSDSGKKVTAEEIIEVLDRELGRSSRTESSSYYGKYSFSGEPDL